MSHLSDLIESGPIIEIGNPVIYLSETAQLNSSDIMFCVCQCMSVFTSQSDASARVYILRLFFQILTTYVIFASTTLCMYFPQSIKIFY